ncbi:MAG: hypothetical protein IJI51_03685, partial [Lachnospiraceae bacterium]|nr:hypothetical protein [Lachnospiraceae bacterium]
MKNRITIGKIIKYAIFIAIIAVMVRFAYPYIKELINGGKDDQYKDIGYAIDFESYESKLAGEQSDIDGWTRLDKQNAGLQVKDGSDTDGDGLTDKDEIEVYGSDPKKMSTAGDFYSDGYKVANNMDLNTYYESETAPVFEKNECSEIKLTASRLEDLRATVKKDVPSMYK